jgi:hypothetical protein
LKAVTTSVPMMIQNVIFFNRIRMSFELIEHDS